MGRAAQESRGFRGRNSQSLGIDAIIGGAQDQEVTTDSDPRRAVFVAFDDFLLLDLAGPLEVLRSANLLGASPPYETAVATPDGRPVTSSSGVTIHADVSLAQLSRGASRRSPKGEPEPSGRGHQRRARTTDVLVVVGGLGVDGAIARPGFVDDLAAASRRTRLVASVCTGALALAAAGLLDDRQATTHWASCDLMATRHPEVTVLPDRIHVRDGDVWTSAGVTAGIDLGLALVEEDHGRELAHQVAGWLVVFAQRPGGQVQFSAQLRAQAATTPSIVDVQRWMAEHLDEDLTVAALARRAHMSERTFARAFRAETGTTPAAHAESLRVEAARRLLESTDLTVGAIARRLGFAHGETLHRVFLKRVGTTPDRYRQHFAPRSA
jgi:transcriptional regulator GlxA family with amidase domain